MGSGYGEARVGVVIGMDMVLVVDEEDYSALFFF